MYQLTIIKDTIALHPVTFSQPAQQALKDELNKKYADRVIPDVGLGVCVFDLLAVSEGKVRYGDGCFWHKLTFRLVVFRPFISEVIVGTIKECTEKAVIVSTGFFDDIIVPASLLPHPHAYDPNEKTHFWLASEAETEPTEAEMLDSELTDRLYLDCGEIVRVRVENDEFYDDEPGPPMAVNGVYTRAKAKRPHYEITVSLACYTYNFH
ncbi:DNA-directed RNA polymerase III subunit rpc25 [Tulasnella sp. JGI-2019a]|nr:DNA-directed RNA polymerase III subunit rpc25 [Tulasnella sp. JGI-2019a]